jgi:hypothetical protein
MASMSMPVPLGKEDVDTDLRRHDGECRLVG